MHTCTAVSVLTTLYLYRVAGARYSNLDLMKISLNGPVVAGELDVEGDGQHLADALHQVPVLIQYVALLHSVQGLNTNTWIASGRGGERGRTWSGRRRNGAWKKEKGAWKMRIRIRLERGIEENEGKKRRRG